MRRLCLTPLLCLSLLPAFGCLVTVTDDIATTGGVDGEGDWGETSGATAEGDWGGDGDPGGTGDGDPTGGDPGDGDGDTAEDTEGETDTGEDLCNEDEDVVLYLSPDDSNSMSSPVQVRERVLEEGSFTLGSVPIRVWEFMNYYNFDYPAAEPGELALFANMQPLEGAEDTYQLQLAVTSELMGPAERPAMNVTLVLDTSGSMSGEPINMLRESCRAIAASLQVGDTVSVVEWDTEDTWVMAGYEVSGPSDPLLLDTINAVEPGGGTDLNGGLVSGYNLAKQVYDPGMLNRIVLISDGGANAGVTEIDLIAENAVFGGADGIYMVGVGVAQGSNYNDELMNEVTDAGKGASVFINDMDEAWKIFNEDFENTMAIAGRDVQVELTMPPGFEIVKFSGEEFSSDPKEVEPQHIAPNDAMVFHQEVVTCAPELADDNAKIIVRARWIDPWSFKTREVAQTWSFGELMALDQSQLLKGAAILAYAESLKAFSKASNDDQRTAALAPAFAAMAPAQQALPADSDLLEIAMILAQLNP